MSFKTFVPEYHQDLSPRRRKLPHEMHYEVERPITDYGAQQYKSPRQQPQNYPQQYQDPYQQRAEPQYKHTYDDSNQGYDTTQPAGRANNYNTQITDLLTSIRDPPGQSPNLTDIIEANKGYLVLMRFRPQDLPEVITAIQDTVSTIQSHTGYVIGFASPDDMRILIANPESLAKDQWWDPRGRPRFALCCMWFRDVFACKRWFESAPRIKQPDFPNSSPYQVVAVPLTFGRNQEPLPFELHEDGVTLLWHEFPNIYERSPRDFCDHYSEPARKLMKHYGATPHISLCKYEAGWPPEPNKFGQPGYARFEQQHERKARAVRTGWVEPNTYITVSAFPNMKCVMDYFNDDYSQKIHAGLSKYTHSTAVAFSMRKVHGTSR